MSKGLLFVAVIALMDVVAQNFQKDKNDDFDHHHDQTIQQYHDFHYLEKSDRIWRKSTQWINKLKQKKTVKKIWSEIRTRVNCKIAERCT